MRAGCTGLIVSALALSVSLATWLAIPVSAFSTMCLPGLGPFYNSPVACTQLDAAFCQQNCHVDNQIIRTGSTGFGLILFSVLLQGVCAVYWHYLEVETQEVCESCRPLPHRRSSPVLGQGVVHASGDDHRPPPPQQQQPLATAS